VRISNKINYPLHYGKSQRPSGLKRRFAVDLLLGLRVWILPDALIFVCREYCVLSERSLKFGPVTSPTGVVCYCVWSINLKNERPWPKLGCCAKKEYLLLQDTLIVIISPTYPQLFLYYIHLAYMFRPMWSSSGRLRYTKVSKMCLKYLQYIKCC
jgi:hypothetical protein